jgi:hypothetical protein
VSDDVSDQVKKPSPIGATSYTAVQREEALALALQKGNAQAARQLGIPRGTLQRWLAEAGLNNGGVSRRMEAAHEGSKLRRERLLERAMYALDRMDKPHVEVRGTTTVRVPAATDAGVQALALAAAVLIDKYRLEVGEATTRGETRDLTHDDHEAELLRDAIRGELARRHQRSADLAPDDTEPGRPPERADDGAAPARADAPALAGDAPTSAGPAE